MYIIILNILQILIHSINCKYRNVILNNNIFYMIYIFISDNNHNIINYNKYS